jgi:hypothetical protein
MTLKVDTGYNIQKENQVQGPRKLSFTKYLIPCTLCLEPE